MLTIYNTLTNQKEKFTPLQKGKVNFYSCGPTVYDYAHIGNLRTYLFTDVLKRTLEFNGYEVNHIMNITDVGHLTNDDLNQGDSGEDKMLKAVKKANQSKNKKITPENIAEFYTGAFMKDINTLNIEEANFYPRATAHIPQIIKIIERLIEKGFAYEKNGNVFYDVEKFSKYGKLSNKKLKELRHGARLENHPDKKHSYDFALWLKAPEKHILKWNSPWGTGYPGWHIECTAMSIEYLGDTLDLHTGGEDNIFPHHENEIAQSEAYTGKPFVLYWAHPRHLLVDGQKMSKSKGNFYILSDILDKGYSAMDFRILVLSSHYRSNLNFTWKAMEQASKNFQKIESFIQKIKDLQSANNNSIFKDKKEEEPQVKLNIQIGSVNLQKCLDKFTIAINDDLNTPLALSIVYRFINEVNKVKDLRIDQIENILNFWKKVNKVLGIKLNFSKKAKSKIPLEILDLVKQRENARQKKDFILADKLRSRIISAGYYLEDTPTGAKVSKKR